MFHFFFAAMPPVVVGLEQREEGLCEEEGEGGERRVADLSAQELLLQIADVYIAGRIPPENVKADSVFACKVAVHSRSHMQSARGATTVARFVAEEEELAGLSRGEEPVEQLAYIMVCKEILQNRWTVKSTKTKRLLQLGGEPPVPVFH